jgi:hypothetical protein
MDMPENPDETLSSRGAPVPDEVRDESPDLEPKDFDADAFLRGVRPTVRSVRIYDQAQLIGPMEELADDIDLAPDGPETDAMIDELEVLRKRFFRGTQYYIEGRSSEWVKRFRADAARRLGADVGDWDGTTDPTDDAQRAARVGVLIEQLAAQIVKPGQVSPDTLTDLADTNEPEFAKLLACLSFANSQGAAASSVLTRDFSARRSTKRPGPRRSATR